MPTHVADVLYPFLLVLVASLGPLFFLFTRPKRGPVPVGLTEAQIHAAILQKCREEYGDDVVIETVNGETNVYVGEMARLRKRAA